MPKNVKIEYFNIIIRRKSEYHKLSIIKIQDIFESKSILSNASFSETSLKSVKKDSASDNKRLSS